MGLNPDMLTQTGLILTNTHTGFKILPQLSHAYNVVFLAEDFLATDFLPNPLVLKGSFPQIKSRLMN